MRDSHIRGFMVVNPGSRSGYRQATLVRVKQPR
jgi:predicted phosphodiesterase